MNPPIVQYVAIYHIYLIRGSILEIPLSLNLKIILYAFGSLKKRYLSVIEIYIQQPLIPNITFSNNNNLAMY